MVLHTLQWNLHLKKYNILWNHLACYWNLDIEIHVWIGGGGQEWGFSRWKLVFPQQHGRVQDQGHSEHLINDYVYVCSRYWCAPWELKWFKYSPSLFHFCSQTMQIEIKNKETSLFPRKEPAKNQTYRSAKGAGLILGLESQGLSGSRGAARAMPPLRADCAYQLR